MNLVVDHQDKLNPHYGHYHIYLILLKAQSHMKMKTWGLAYVFLVKLKGSLERLIKKLKTYIIRKESIIIENSKILNILQIGEKKYFSKNCILCG